MTRVERRDPPKLYHKMTVEELRKAGARFRLERLFHKDRRRIARISSRDSERCDSRLFPYHE